MQGTNPDIVCHHHAVGADLSATGRDAALEDSVDLDDLPRSEPVRQNHEAICEPRVEDLLPAV